MYFVENTKIRQRHDEVVAYGEELMRELEIDCATFKSFQGFVERFNIFNGPSVKLNENAFRNAWFKYTTYCEVSICSTLFYFCHIHHTCLGDDHGPLCLYFLFRL